MYDYGNVLEKKKGGKGNKPGGIITPAREKESPLTLPGQKRVPC